jgi:hypothetical protein
VQPKEQLGPKSGGRASAALAPTGVAGSHWQTVNFRNVRGEQSQSFTFTDPSGGAGYSSMLGLHRIRYEYNDIREFMINWGVSRSGDQVTVTVYAAAYSTNNADSVNWDADIEIGVVFFS